VNRPNTSSQGRERWEERGKEAGLLYSFESEETPTVCRSMNFKGRERHSELELPVNCEDKYGEFGTPSPQSDALLELVRA
jgi:hypothetical protein